MLKSSQKRELCETFRTLLRVASEFDAREASYKAECDETWSERALVERKLRSCARRSLLPVAVFSLINIDEDD